MEHRSTASPRDDQVSDPDAPGSGVPDEGSIAGTPFGATSLLAAAQDLLQSFGRGDPLRNACRLTRDVLDADLVAAFRSRDGGRTFRSQAQYGLSDEAWAGYQHIELPAEIVDRIRDRLSTSNVSVIDVSAPGTSPADTERRTIGRKLGIGPLLLLGLSTGGVLNGLMVVCRDASRESFDATAISVASAFGPLLAAGLENQRLLEALETAHQAQTEFLANMSHELRTPLNVITGYLDMLLDGLAGPLGSAQRELCERIRRSAYQQLSLVGEAFEISRRDAAGRIPARREEVRVATLVSELEREAALRPAAPDVTVVWRLRERGLVVVSDPVKLRMIVRNLVDNAIKFTERGQVAIDVSLEDDVLVWSVEDTGRGIPEHERDVMFEAFRQVGGHSTGLGLGLHIVRRLTDALGGTVEVQSRVGHGSRFTVRVPTDLAPLGRAHPATP